MPPRPASILGPLLFSFALSLAPLAVAAQGPLIKMPQVDTPTRVLFVGNSYLYCGDSLHNHVQRLAIAADPILDGKMD